jgi:hypothetical protein
VGRDSHNGSGSVVSEDVVSYPEGDLFVVERVYYMGAGKNSCFFFSFVGSVLVRFVFTFCDIVLTYYFLFICDEISDIIVVWSNYCISYSKYGVYTCGIDRKSFAFII